MKIIRQCLVLAGVLACLTGCQENVTVVELNSDGSGQIIISECTPASVIKEAEGTKYTWRFNEEGRRRDAKTVMGNYKGVTLGPVTEIKNADGSRGCRVVYRFKDITKVKLYLPTMLRESHVTFSYTNRLLSVHMPEIRYTPDRLDPHGSEFRSKLSEYKKNEQKYKPYKYRLILKMPTSIKETNASYRGSPTNPADKSVITIVDINLEETLNDTRGRTEFMSYSLSPETYMATAKLLNGTPGVKYETNAVINIPVVLAPSEDTTSKQELNGKRAKDAEKAFYAFFNAMRAGDFETYISFFPKDFIQEYPEAIDRQEFLETSENFRSEVTNISVNDVVIKEDIATVNATFHNKSQTSDTELCKLKLTDGKWFVHVGGEEPREESAPSYSQQLDDKVDVGTDLDMRKINQAGKKSDREVADIIEKSVLWKAKIHEATWEPMELAKLLKDEARFTPDGNFYKVQDKIEAFGSEVLSIGLVGIDWAHGPNVIVRSNPKTLAAYIAKKYGIKLEYKADAEAYMADLGKDLRLVIIEYPGMEGATLVIGEYTGM